MATLFFVVLGACVLAVISSVILGLASAGLAAVDG